MTNGQSHANPAALESVSMRWMARRETVALRRSSRGRSAVRITYLRSDLKLARTSAEKSWGCSQAAKWPPRSTLL